MVRRCCCSDNIAAADLSYVTTTPETELSNEQALSPLGTGLLKNAGGTGILSIASPGVDYAAVSHTHDADQIVSGILDYERGGAMVADGRLTLQTATPVPNGNLTAQTTLYYTPFIGERLTLYDGTKWQPYTFTEPSISLAAIANATNYDVFGYLSSGTPALELLAWSTDLVRATVLARSVGIWIKSGDPTRRFLGTIRGSAAGQCEDSLTTSPSRAFVWNAYNRVMRFINILNGTAHNYNSATIQSWNADDTIRFEWVTGLQEEAIAHHIQGDVAAITDTQVAQIGIGIDTNSAITSSAALSRVAQNLVVGVQHIHMPSIGYHFAQAVEGGNVTSNPSFNEVRLQAYTQR